MSPWKENSELLAADGRSRLTVPSHRCDRTAYCPQEAIALRVSVLVIDPLEMIEIDNQERGPRQLSLRDGVFLIKPSPEVSEVLQRDEFVAVSASSVSQKLARRSRSSCTPSTAPKVAKTTAVGTRRYSMSCPVRVCVPIDRPEAEPAHRRPQCQDDSLESPSRGGDH